MHNELTITDGWASPARHMPSPNFSDRPANCLIDTLIVHNISLPPGKFGAGYIDQLFCNTLNCSEHEYFAQLEGVKVSAHILIERSGAMVQYVPFHKKAWHAGESEYKGRQACNDFSIGVELEGTDTEPFTQAQYQGLIVLTQVLIAHYSGLTTDRIVGHSDVAPNRKTDPGPCFDWHYYKGRLEQAVD
jgi:AmpD protein